SSPMHLILWTQERKAGDSNARKNQQDTENGYRRNRGLYVLILCATYQGDDALFESPRFHLQSAHAITAELLK
ncbi:hypothetical protein, partial [Paraburkholderia madseniana]|uniref:hypothetical protein n=1 Tax=Paraburkholderia madseniana TaxID=2599607 RepID=UPI001A7F0105